MKGSISGGYCQSPDQSNGIEYSGFSSSRQRFAGAIKIHTLPQVRLRCKVRKIC
ncbi:hypothetical protein M378DRAFT_163876 [Amanita muscaria Koide BX008]|uniref:Uncharacterized protein n=1 Tax=Amanita muscaria (strain Koide BX008) TaxID=946122 RepID=A0A0C2TB14_AMAMK|nr:hypothetical protein M378DRAFT_163876 [Amanita muscaria Koide BX008]